MFIQLENQYPGWDHMDEARLWLCELYLDEESYEEGIRIADSIQSDTIHEMSVKLIKSTLTRELDYERLLEIHEVFPENKPAGEILADRIMEKPFFQQDRALLQNLIDHFDLDPHKYDIYQSNPSIKKDVYNIAIMFPFMHKNIIPNRVSRSNQFILDMYEGICIAAGDLKEEGINVDVFAYDTWRSRDTVKAILASGEIHGMDLIVGPLYPETVKECAEYSYKNAINMINPLSTNSALIGDNPFSFLFYPVLERQAKAAARFVSKRVENKNAFIFYGTSARDSILAYTYRSEIEKDSFNINLCQKITGKDTISIFNILTNKYKLRDMMEEEEYDSLISSIPEDSVFQTEFFVIEPDSIGHVFVASNSELLGSEAISGVETRGDSILLIGNEEWLEFRSISLEQYGRVGIALVAPAFVDIDKPDYGMVNETIMSIVHSPPTRYHYVGYELMYFTGHMLHKYGNLFQNGFREEGMVKGKLFTGFNYRNSNDNSIVPIIEFVVDEFVITNSYISESELKNE
jgi:hypothetical protein